MLNKRSMLIVLALLLAPFVLAGCSSDECTNPLLEVEDTAPPAAPTCRAAREAGPSAVLFWNGNTEADLAGYNVYSYSPDPLRDNSYQKLNSQLVITTSYGLGALAPGLAHYYRVTAVDASGNESGFSATIEVIPQTSPDDSDSSKPRGLLS